MFTLDFERKLIPPRPRFNFRKSKNIIHEFSLSVCILRTFTQVFSFSVQTRGKARVSVPLRSSLSILLLCQGRAHTYNSPTLQRTGYNHALPTDIIIIIQKKKENISNLHLSSSFSYLDIDAFASAVAVAVQTINFLPSCIQRLICTARWLS